MKMMRVVGGVVGVMCLVGSVDAAITFNYSGANHRGQVSSYMAGLYQGAVNASGEELKTGGWNGQGRYLSLYNRSADADFEIAFDQDALDSASGKIRASGSGTVWVRAYGSNYGNKENPSDFLKEWSCGSGGAFDFSFVDRTASLLVFCGRSNCDIWLDDLCVCKHPECPPVPAPGALFLGAVGTALVGWLRQGMGLRRKG